MTRSGEGDAQAAESAGETATAPGARSPFRLVIHFIGMADRLIERIRGGDGRDFLHGKPKTDDHFDADAGGDDILFGMSGDDVYWLGPGTGKDTIVEVAGDTGNVIRLEKEPATHGVRLLADERHLHVALVDDKGEETDRHTVVDHFGRGTGIARVELPDGKTLFDRADFNAAWFSFVSSSLVFPPVAPGGPGPGEDGITRVWEENRFIWTGSPQAGDSFLPGDDSLHAPDDYRGRGGDDVYWLGIDTGHDRVREHEDNPQGDPGDAIVIKGGVSAPGQGVVTDPDHAVSAAGDGPVAWVHRSPNGRDLVVAVVERQPGGGHRTVASLTVDGFFVLDSAQVERIVFADDPSATLSLKDLRRAAIVGWPEDDDLEGGPGPDVFDSSAGGDDRLYGYGGDDTYHLGPGTGTDTVFEHHGNAQGDGGDRVVVKEGVRIPKVDGIWRIGDGQEPTLRVRRSDNGKDLSVEVTANGEVVSALVVDGHYAKPNGRVEGIRDAQGREVMSEGDLKEARIVGDPGNNVLVGSGALDDHFDISAGGADTLYGYAGSDVYWLGSDGGGTGTIREWWKNSGGSGDTDVIRLKEDLSAVGADGRRRSLRVWRSDDGRDLHVALLVGGEVGGAHIVEDQYWADRSNAEIERVLSADGDVILDMPALLAARIVGDEGKNVLVGSRHIDDHFDISAGGNDRLLGYDGSDVYWLGSTGGGTGMIEEFARARRRDGSGDTPGDIDVIRLKEDISAVGEDGRRRSLKVWRADNGRDLHVALLVDGEVGSAYVVKNQYRRDDSNRQVERILSVDGEILHDEASLSRAGIFGDWGDNVLIGSAYFGDHFDISAGGNDVLYGYNGSDVYWLGSTGGGTGRIREYGKWSEGFGTAGDIDVIRLKEDISAVGDDGRRRSLKIWRSDDGGDLHVALLVDGRVGEAYIVEDQYRTVPLGSDIERILSVDGEILHDEASLSRARIVGDRGDNRLFGSAHIDDHFDISAGGRDVLSGSNGSDVYWLGSGGDRGLIRESVAWTEGFRDASGDIDVVRLKEDISAVGDDGFRRSLKIWRSANGQDLHVALMVGGRVGGSYVVMGQYILPGRDQAIERILSVGGETIHDETALSRARIVGGRGNDVLVGSHHHDDHFDISAGGNDALFGSNGSDVYWLGSTGGGTGRISESASRCPGFLDNSADIDVIRLKEDLSAVGEDGRRRSLKVWRSGNALHVALLVDGEVGSEYIVNGQYSAGATDAQIERILSVEGEIIHDEAFLLRLRIAGDRWDNTLFGSPYYDDHFDISAGGDDILHGYSGSDIYWLGSDGGGTGTIRESTRHWRELHRDSSGDIDVVRLKEDVSVAGEDGRRRSLEVWRSDDGHDLHVALLVDGEVGGAYVVEDHYRLGDARVEAVLSVDGHVIHDADALAKAPIVGGAGDDSLHGTDLTDDHFDGSRGGNDHLYGYGGDDIYWLGRGTGDDQVHEYHQNEEGDSGDAIRIVSRHIKRSDVDVAREGDNLVVRLLGGDGTPTDSITVVRHFSDKAARVESIELNGRTLLVRDLVAAIDAIAGFNAGGPWGATLDLAPDSGWRDPSDFLGGPAT